MRRRRWMRRVGAVFGTVVLGGLLGFLVPTVAAEFAPPAPDAPPRSTESPIARQFITAFLGNDQETLKLLKVAEETTVRATTLASTTKNLGRPVLLGVKAFPGASFHAYASTATLADGSDTILSWRVVTINGLPYLILPPDPIEGTP
ncbi:MAG TPA: hypothetical protein VFY18_13045 [Candidatus Limnocylindrales bacterium]|nr:hypothetical protein [Candidatus Limnocylindrales bacterium]